MKQTIKTILILFTLFLINCSYDRIGPLWPNGKVYYKFCSDFTDKEKNIIKEAMDDWAMTGIVSFIETDKSYYVLKIYKSDWINCSTIGYGENPQLSISYVSSSVALHELGHALGFLHEFQRPDRDEYITIHFENIEEGEEHNFIKAQWYEFTYNYKIYDFDYNSIMGYNPWSFSKNGEDTIEAPVLINIMRITNLDYDKLYDMYMIDHDIENFKTSYNGL